MTPTTIKKIWRNKYTQKACKQRLLRKARGLSFTALDGDICCSSHELRLDNFLYFNKIKHEVQVKLPESNYICDQKIITDKNKEIYLEMDGLNRGYEGSEFTWGEKLGHYEELEFSKEIDGYCIIHYLDNLVDMLQPYFSKKLDMPPLKELYGGEELHSGKRTLEDHIKIIEAFDSKDTIVTAAKRFKVHQSTIRNIWVQHFSKKEYKERFNKLGLSRKKMSNQQKDLIIKSFEETNKDCLCVAKENNTFLSTVRRMWIKHFSKEAYLKRKKKNQNYVKEKNAKQRKPILEAFNQSKDSCAAIARKRNIASNTVSRIWRDHFGKVAYLERQKGLKKVSPKQKEAILKGFDDLNATSAEIGKLYGFSRGTISRIWKEHYGKKAYTERYLNCTKFSDKKKKCFAKRTNKEGKLNFQQKESIIEAFSDLNQTTVSVAKVYGVSSNSIRRIWKDRFGKEVYDKRVADCRNYRKATLKHTIS